MSAIAAESTAIGSAGSGLGSGNITNGNRNGHNHM